MLHRHHILPIHVGGTNDPSNIELITLEIHAERHKELWEKHGRWQDWCAWKGLSSAIGQEEIRMLIAKITGRLGGLKLKGKSKSEEHKRKLAISSTGNKNSVGRVMTQNQRDKISKTLMGRRHTYEIRLKRANSNRHPRGKYQCVGQPSIICPHCNKTGGANPMRRWHFNNCKKRGVR